jgi:methylenetetrahydrofolate dehydrogenase (NADP+)/methenyltetrahydrofolate cyclohydrolase
MQAIIVDGKLIAGKILSRTRTMRASLNFVPVLAVIQVGEDLASATYIRKKKEAAEAVGVRFLLYKFSSSISQSDLAGEIKKIQQQDLSGLIIQLPLPQSIDKRKILNLLDPALDVDYLSWVSLGKLMIGDFELVPPAPSAILEILKFHKVPLKGKHVVVVGQGDLIGKPLVNLFLREPVTLTTCNRDTKDLGKITRQADILISGVGKYNLIRGLMVKKGAAVIDAGFVLHKGKMSGDVNVEEVAKVAALVTPTPGGVGPVTVAKLLENTVELACRKT